MKRSFRLGLIVVVGLLSMIPVANSQTLIESVVAVVGNEVVYLSDVENAVVEARRSGNRGSLEDIRCRVLHELLASKLFVDQARIDSIIVTDDQVEGDLNLRINEAIRQAGSEEALEAYFKKSMIEIRRDIRKGLVEQQVVSEVRNTISDKVSITPSDVKRYFNSIPKDSLPVIPSKVRISIIQLDPPENEDNKAEARQKLLDIRGEILAGKSFYTEAVMYSEDQGSSAMGGEVGFKLRGELEKEYADVAFSLSKNTVSKIVESKYGFHIIQLIERKGDLANTRHILIRPKVKPEQSARALTKLDSLARLIRKDSLKFEDAAVMYSSHKDSRINGGTLVSNNPSERITWFSLDELSKEMYVKVRDLKIGEISEPFEAIDEIGNTVFRIVRLDDEIPAHRVDLKNDYQNLYNATMMYNQQKSYDKWMKEKIATTYIKISDEFKYCKFLEEGWLK